MSKTLWCCLHFGVVQAEIAGYLGEMAVLCGERTGTMEGRNEQRVRSCVEGGGRETELT
jgi:hypothetical protein